MAERPVFVPTEMPFSLISEVPVNFVWHRGMAISQKKKNIRALHDAAAQRNLFPLLEISTKSDSLLGQNLSAFNLSRKLGRRDVSVECLYQGSKVFEHGGPFTDLFEVGSREAKRDERLRSSGHLVGFLFQDEDFPLSPLTAFYDWLYINALYSHADWSEEIVQYAGFTDIEFNPERSVNCQARSCAIFVSLRKRELLENALESFGSFTSIVQRNST